ncbi:solute carrier organic anion transporter family member 3A1-like [Physella acuta]|uniref:solute carrier organic anion transporter family member 3A1-like n=1 Tax=Physella acuta TaxID=109671 RepID=UPI0027DAFF7E|nr:solute carrier organic anion transporter family member 3A1-like [Physella acuta]
MTKTVYSIEDGSDTTERKEKISKPETDLQDVDLSCGIGKFRSSFFGTYFSNLYMFSFFIGLSTLFTMMVDRIVPIQLQSLEKQFNIDNAEAGLFTTATTIGLMSTILFAGHFTRNSHIPVIVGVAGIAQGVFLMVPAVFQLTDPKTLEELTYGNSSVTSSSSDQYMCTQANNSSNDSSQNSNRDEVNRAAFIVVVIVQVLKGVTDTFHSNFLPTVYLDNNAIDKSKMSIFMGIRQLFSNLAGPIGTEVNGVLTEIPVDLKPTDMSPKDGRFIAAWWLSFLVFGLGTLISSFPLILFPKHLIPRDTQKKSLEEATVSFAGIHTDGKRPDMQAPSEPTIVTTKETSRRVSLTGDVAYSKVELKPSSSRLELLKDFPAAMLRLVKRPVYILILVDIAIISIPTKGIAMFRNMYITNEYNVPMSEVAYASGISDAIGHITGTLVSTWLSSRVHTNTGYIWIMLTTYLLQTCMNPLSILFGCDNQIVYGHVGEYGLAVNLTDGCDCDGKKQLLVCADDGNSYLSPCYAGCRSVVGKMFTDCALNTTGRTAVPGLCPSDCQTNFIVYIAIQGAQKFFDGVSQIPRQLLLLRMVDPRDRAFAMSFFMFFYNIVAIPSPNIFGTVIDATCLVRDDKVCTVYDRDQIRYFLSGVDMAINVVVTITLCINLLLFRWENKKISKKLRVAQAEINVN